MSGVVGIGYYIARLRPGPEPLLRTLRFLLVLVLIGLAVFAGGLYRWASHRVAFRDAPADFRIPAGTGLRGAVGLINAAGVRVNPTLMVILAKVMRAEAGIKAGSYSLQRGATPWDILSKLTRGEFTQGEITLVEGLTLRQWREKLDANPDLVHDTRGLAESELLSRLGIAAARGEGLFFADTYLFDKQSSDLDLLARAWRAMSRRLALEWDRRDPGLPLKTPAEALILASIVEKETGRMADRPHIAAVFINRLRQGMMLQSDPTVIYGVGERFDGNLRKRDLQTDTPYNTYTRPGLPPTPIAMPSMASLQAVLHPAASDAIYFVARGDGSSHFSRTLDEHNRAVSRYQRGGR